MEFATIGVLKFVMWEIQKNRENPKKWLVFQEELFIIRW